MMKNLLSQFKYFLLKWVINENLLRAYVHWRFPRHQKYWFGAPPIPCPKMEKTYFDGCGLKSQIVRRKDDYRPAAFIERAAELRLNHCAGAGSIDLAISPKDSFDARHKPHVSLSLGQKTVEILDLPYERWQDVRLELHSGDHCLKIESNVPLVATMPRGLRNKSTSRNSGNKGVRHVLVLVLDAWTTSVPDQPHPFTGDNTSIPNIERFFASGFKATRGVSNGQWTLPAVGSLFTGLHVSRHKMFHPRRWQEFDPHHRILPEYFQHAGYHTLCGSVVSRVTPAFGHNRGFDRFLYHFGEPHVSYENYNPAVWIQEIIGHLESYHHDRTFSYFQFPDTHPSWDVPPDTRYFHLARRGSTSADLRKLMDPKRKNKIDIPAQAAQIYRLRLAELDRMLAALFEYVERHFGLEALVVVTADHGLRMPYLSEAYRNDEPFLTDVRVNIPLYMRGGNIVKAEFKDLCLPNADLPVMLLQQADIKPDSQDLDGIDLLDQGLKREAVITEYAYAGIYEVAVRGGGHALFLKYRIDDVTFKLREDKPFYTGLYPLNSENYSPEKNLASLNPQLVTKLCQVAQDHFVKTGMLDGTQRSEKPKEACAV